MLARTKGRVNRAAEDADISSRQLNKLMVKYGIQKEAQLFQDDPPDGRTESRTSGVASGDAGQDSLATSVPLVQLLLPFM